ncbi:MAG: helix-turn-helix transcriptional regulator [Bacillota bacterium]
MTHLGCRIRATRERIGLTQLMLARKVGVDRSHISKIEAGETAGSVQLITRIAAVLGVKVSELIDEAEATGTEGM